MLPPWVAAVEASPIATAVRSRIWVFPAIESAHLIALAVLAGAVLVVDLRVLGAGVTSLDPQALARQARPWFRGSLVVLILTGLLLAASEAGRCYGSPPLWVKMALLVTAIAYAAGIRRRALAGLDGGAMTTAARVVSLVSIALWTAVAVAGRSIAFY